MLWYGLMENEHEIRLTCVYADSREEAFEMLDRNDYNLMVLSKTEMANLIDALPMEAGEETVL